MPGLSGAGEQSIVICSGVEQKIVYVQNEGAAGKGTHESADNPCAFSFVPVASTVDAPALPVLIAAPRVAAAPVFISFVLPARLPVSHLSTGPPAITRT